MALQTLENSYWQVGILPETGSSTAFGRVRRGDDWLDVMRPTAVSDYDNSSQGASFIMVPWCNRLRDAHFRFEGKAFQLQPSSEDGTAIHGTVRKLAWQVASADKTHLVTTFDSAAHPSEVINFPFRFSARAEFWLDGADFKMSLLLKNEDTQAFPAGFGHHPYFVRPADNGVQIEIPCDDRFELANNLAFAPPVPVDAETDFRTLHRLSEQFFQQVYTARSSDLAARMVYPDAAISMFSDPLFIHTLLYAPEGKPFYAIEPMTNTNDGFNLFDQGITGNGVFVLAPGESKSADMSLRLESGS